LVELGDTWVDIEASDFDVIKVDDDTVLAVVEYGVGQVLGDKDLMLPPFDSVIVRIMKARKMLRHNELVSEAAR
jgi:hypothetical protein